MAERATHRPSDSDHHERILAALREDFEQFYQVSEMDLDLDRHTTFLAMGADSLSLLQISQSIQERYGVRIPFRALMEEVDTLDALARRIADEQGPEATPAESPTPLSAEAVAESTTTSGPAGNGHAGNGHAGNGHATQGSAPTVDASSIASTLPHGTTSVAAQQLLPQTDGLGTVEQIVARQLELMGRQLDALRQAHQGNGGATQPAARAEPSTLTAAAAPIAEPAARPAPAHVKRNGAPGNGASGNGAVGNGTASNGRTASKPPTPAPSTGALTPRQQRYLDQLCERLATKTAGSKQRTDDDRPVLADSRVSSGFRRLWKEICYQIVVERAQGARLWDVDGNEYVDISMGFGSLLFGHSPEFVTQAIAAEVGNGMQLGPQSRIAGEVASLVCELTGVERVSFCNSGTEAVMTAIRLARTTTGRHRIALFQGSYHGTFDGVMTRRARDNRGSLPMAPGTPQGMVDDVLTLTFGDPAALDAISAEGDQLAAVLIEPVASRRPQERSGEFLRQLRRITRERGIVLLFDEVITGFRSHPGGVQALYDVEADLVTYGKAAGAGMPIGIVAGKASVMDAIDGGAWRYGDDSYPMAQTTVFRGTFFKHPLVMVACRAALQHLRDHGPSLQEGLTARTAGLCARLNAIYEAEDVPIRMFHFASLMLFTFRGASTVETELFFYQLLQNGVYVWEGRTCYLSTAHTDADLDHVVRAVEKTLRDLRAGGFLLRDASKQTAETPSEAQDSTADPAHRAPMSAAQRDLWASLSTQDGVGRAYNESIAVLLRGSGLQVSALETALAGLVERHEALRSTVAADGESLEIALTGTLPLPVTDLTSPDTSRDAAFARWLDTQAGTPFALRREPPARFALARLGEDRHVLAMTVHHLLTDGWSNGVLLQELRALYVEATGGEPAELPAPTSMRQSLEQLAAKAADPTQHAAALTYWRDTLAGVPPTLDLPVDHPRSSDPDLAGGEASQTLDPALLHALEALAQERGATLFALLLASFSVLLHRLSGQDDLVVTTAAAGQPALGARSLVGYFLDLLPLRSRLDATLPFADHLGLTRRQVLDAFQHRQIPLSELVRHLDLPREPGRPPLVTATFNLDQAAPDLDFGLDGVELQRIPNGEAKFELSLNASETTTGLHIDWDYRRALFEPTTITRWMGCFETLLRAMVADPTTPLAALPLLDATARHEVLATGLGIQTKPPRDATLAELFDQQATQRPDAPALTYDDGRYTYGELAQVARQLAGRLRDHGVGPEDRVGLFLERSATAVVALVATVQAGAAYLPLDPDLPSERLALLLDDAAPKLVLTTADVAPRLPDTVVERLELTVDDLDPKATPRKGSKRAKKAQTLEALNVPVDPQGLAYVLYTSGSTGRPKGVAVSHRAIVDLVRETDFLQLEPGQRVGQAAVLSFDAATFEIWGALLSGAEVVGLDREVTLSPARFAETLAEHPVDALFLTTALFNTLSREAADTLAAVPHLLFGGQRVDPEAVRALLAHRDRQDDDQGRLLHVYGPTEATTFATWHPVDAVPEQATHVPIGRPLANSEAQVLDPRLEPVPSGVPGEFYLAGDALARGYLGRPATTAAVFVPHPHASSPGERLYRTGDRVRRDAAGSLEFLGRVDDQVKIRGFRIEPGEVESVLTQHPEVETAAVVARPDAADGGLRLIAYATSDVLSATPVQTADLQAFLAKRLPAYMVPSALVLLDALPLNANGKVDRQALPDPTGTTDHGSTYAPPTTATEETLVQVWGEVLAATGLVPAGDAGGPPRLGIDDNFFELGGDSILAIQIIARAEEAGLRLRPKQLFMHPTIRELAALATAVDAADSESDDLESEETAVTPEGPLVATPIQRWFLEGDPTDQNHFNMAMAVDLRRDLDPAILEQALQHLLDHHAGLRLVVDGAAKQPADTLELLPPGQRLDFRVHGVGDLAPEAQETEIERVAAERQTGFDLASGPLFNATLFRRGDTADRLLMVAHHLAVDLFSWRVLLKDLETVCDQLVAGETPVLPRSSTHLRDWAQRLANYARGPEVEAELPHWRNLCEQPSTPLPRDFDDETNPEGSTDTVILSFGIEETEVLLQQVPRHFGTQINDALLTALSPALVAWAGGPVRVDLEGHGREDLFDGVDLSRTVGWFTSIYPVLLDIPRLDDPAHSLGSMRDQLRKLHNGGIGFGLLAHGRGEDPATEALRRVGGSEVTFNYLGHLDATAASGLFSLPLQEATGPTRSPRRQRPALLDVNVLVVGGRLRLYLAYSDRLHRRESLEALGEAYFGHLRTLVDACAPSRSEAEKADATDATDLGLAPDVAPDVSLSGLDLEELDELLSEVEAGS